MATPEAASLPVDEARRTVLEHARPLGSERVGLLGALGRVTAEACVSRVDLPPWDNSAMDGYAVRAAEISSEPIEVVVDVPAGASSDTVLPERGIARIMTGAPVPAGADAVVPVEQTRGPRGPARFADVGEPVHFEAPPTPGANIRRRGEVLRSGDVAVPPGVLVGAPHAAMAAAVGRSTLTVFRQPVVAIVSTGDELVDIDDAADRDRIVNSNAWGVAAQVVEAGGVPRMLPIAADRPDAVAGAVAEALRADVVITTGGISVGEHDHVREALEANGVTILFRRVAIRPGGPVAFGRAPDGRCVFALPGNPVSALVTFELFVRPALRKMAGSSRPFRRTFGARLDEDVSRHPAKTLYGRARLDADDGGWRVSLTGPQGSGVLSSVVEADALVEIPPGEEPLPAGTVVRTMPIGERARAARGEA